MRNLFLSLGLVAASMGAAQADVWTTTEPDGTQTRTVVGRPDQPAREYSAESRTRRFQPSQTHTITKGAQIPNNVNGRDRDWDRDRDWNRGDRYRHGSAKPYYYPYYPYPYGYYPQPSYPAPIYGYPPTYTPIAPGAGIITGGGTVYGYPYPYGYAPSPVYPQGYYPYGGVPSWNQYGQQGIIVNGGVVAGSGSYSSQSNTTGGGISIGRGGARVNVGGSRTTTSGSYSTFP